MVDMCALAKEGYFHPEMKGSLSIKYVLPAIRRSNPELHKVPWFKKYAATDGGDVLSPYDTLPASSAADLLRSNQSANQNFHRLTMPKEN